MNDAQSLVIYVSLVFLLVVITATIVLMSHSRKIMRDHDKFMKRMERERSLSARSTGVMIKMHEILDVGESFEFGSSRRGLRVGSIVEMGNYGYAKIVKADAGLFKAVRVL